MFRQLLLPVKTAVKNCMLDSVALSQATGSGNCGGIARAVPSMSSGLHTSPCLSFGRKQRKQTGSEFVEKRAVAEGEGSSIVEMQRTRMDDRFPDVNLPTRLFNGTMFKDLHILNVHASMNNTIINVTDSIGVPITIRSCGYDGFKNARKGTNVAAQATGFTLGKKILQRGIRTVRVRVNGLGAGRLASLRGLTLAGVQIVSITDNTPVSWNPPRPRKQRRL